MQTYRSRCRKYCEMQVRLEASARGTVSDESNRFHEGTVLWRNRHGDWVRVGDFSTDLFCVATFPCAFSIHTSSSLTYLIKTTQAIKGIPTCYILPCPWDYNQTNPPFHCLVPYGSGREPGLILISTTGEIRFWDSIGIGLAGGDRYTTTHLGIGSEDLVTNLIRVDVRASSLLLFFCAYNSYWTLRLSNKHTLLQRHPDLSTVSSSRLLVVNTT